jgi:hypothetical protein
VVKFNGQFLAGCMSNEQQYFQHRNPFKTKPPLVDWFEVPAADMGRWEELARLAMQKMKEAVK